MRLLDTSTLQFQEFWGRDVPRYAILSHTWEDGEVSFHEMRDGTGEEEAGYSKILGSCALAAKDGFKYVWIDTCCIDKTSSAELSEAINSMYEWYARAEVCYAYLTDVIVRQNSRPRTMESFRASRWFTRGWTLQELLAPSMVIFYGRDWKEIGTKLSLSEEISSCTGIARSDVVDFRRTKSKSNKEANIAVKMSWASERETTRIEDTAYCLLGIFGVNMPLLYGEGKAAFIRLQLEILKISDDETIFAWSGRTGHSGLLSTSPTAFRDSGGIRQVIFDRGRPEYSMTNKGLRIELLLSQAGESPLGNDHAWELKGGEVYAAVLNCTQESDDRPLEIYLQSDRNSRYGGSSQFTRITTYPVYLAIGTVPHTRRRDYLTKKERTVVYVKQKDTPADAPPQHLQPFMLPKVSIRYTAALFHVSEIWPLDTRYTLDEDGVLQFAASLTLNFGAIFESHDKNYSESFAILVTELPKLFVPLAVTLMIVPPGTMTFGNGKIVQFFTSRSRPIESGRDDTWRCEGVGLSDGEPMTWGQFNRTCRSDRLSKLLPSGSSVSVALRQHHAEEVRFVSDNQWVIDITVDPKGGLPWPSRTTKIEEEEAGEDDRSILTGIAYDLDLRPLQQVKAFLNIPTIQAPSSCGMYQEAQFEGLSVGSTIRL